MTVVEWFDSLDGPKTVCYDGEQFACMVGWNEKSGRGVRGREACGYGSTPDLAMAAARAEYDKLRCDN